MPTYPKKTSVLEMLDSINELNAIYVACKRFVETETSKGLLDPIALKDFDKSVDRLNAIIMKGEVHIGTPNTTVTVVPDVVADYLPNMEDVMNNTRTATKKTKPSSKKPRKTKTKSQSTEPSTDTADETSQDEATAGNPQDALDPTDVVTVDKLQADLDSYNNVMASAYDALDPAPDEATAGIKTDCDTMVDVDELLLTPNGNAVSVVDGVAVCDIETDTTNVVDDKDDADSEPKPRKRAPRTTNNKNLLRLANGHKHKVKRVIKNKCTNRKSWGPRADEACRAKLLEACVETYIDKNYITFSQFGKAHHDMYMALWHRNMLSKFVNTLRDYGVKVEVDEKNLIEYEKMVEQNPLL